MPTDPKLEELERLLAADNNAPTGVCNKCGYVGKCDEMMGHMRPNGSDCSYRAARVMPTELQQELRRQAPTLIATARECERLRTALKWYADADYSPPQDHDAEGNAYPSGQSEVERDGGARAAAALADPATPGREPS